MINFMRKKQKMRTLSFATIPTGDVFYRSQGLWLKVSFDAAFEFKTGELRQLGPDAEIGVIDATLRWRFAP